ncbi:MAG: hypothetical protein NDI90_02265 [Nitrospira sp. BO4]|jgi:hypothetical protein|nr:hypothetical protein [Nitrospira sp. BO4]
MRTSVEEFTDVYAVLDQCVGSSRDGIISAVYVDAHLAHESLAQVQSRQNQMCDQQWSVVEFPVTSLLSIPSTLTMLCVVYEGDEQGIRPLHLYAQERLAQLRVRELDIKEQLRLLEMQLLPSTDACRGAGSHKKSYWWELCPLVQ